MPEDDDDPPKMLEAFHDDSSVAQVVVHGDPPSGGGGGTISTGDPVATGSGATDPPPPPPEPESTVPRDRVHLGAGETVVLTNQATSPHGLRNPTNVGESIIVLRAVGADGRVLFRAFLHPGTSMPEFRGPAGTVRIDAAPLNDGESGDLEYDLPIS